MRKRLATTPWHALAPQAAVDTRATQYVAGSSGRPPSAVSADATVGADRRLPGRRRSRRGGFAGEAAEPPAKAVGTPAPFAAAYADVLPESHREAVRDTAITYLDECSSAIAEGEPGQSYTDTMIGAYLPQRYEQYYDGRFARDWATTIAVVGWKLAHSAMSRSPASPRNSRCSRSSATRRCCSTLRELDDRVGA